MRVIAGEWRGIPLVAPSGDAVRPTTDRVKESMFNLVGPVFEGTTVLDLFAGSGSLGLEALSRGAVKAVFADVSAAHLRVVEANVEKCRAKHMVTIYKSDWRVALQRLQNENMRADWVFVDPPYALKLWHPVLEMLSANHDFVGGVICEHPKSDDLPLRVGDLQMVKSRAYGDICVTIYKYDAKSTRGVR